MNSLLMPSLDPKEVFHLNYKNQPQQTQKKLLDFLINKNISFYQATPKNFEAIVQIYNIQADKKPNSLSKSPSKPTNSSKSPLKSSIKKKKFDETTLNHSLSENQKKIDKRQGNSSMKVLEKNISKENDKNKETLKKKSPSVHNLSHKNKAKGKVFLEEFNKTSRNEPEEMKNSKKLEKSQKNLAEKVKITNENLGEKDKNLAEKEKILAEKEKNLTEKEKNSMENLAENEKSRVLMKKKRSVKNDLSMKILQKNKQILDNLINANSVLEFEAKKNRNSHDKNKENNQEIEKKSSKLSDIQEKDHNLQEKSFNNLNKPHRYTTSGYLKNEPITRNKNKSLCKQNYKENLVEKKIIAEKIEEKQAISISEKSETKKSISDKIEHNFKQIVSKEFSHLPSGEKINKNSLNLQFQKAVQILYERLDLLSSEELIFYYKFIVNKAKKLYLDFLQKRGLVVN